MQTWTQSQQNIEVEREKIAQLEAELRSQKESHEQIMVKPDVILQALNDMDATLDQLRELNDTALSETARARRIDIEPVEEINSCLLLLDQLRRAATDAQKSDAHVLRKILEDAKKRWAAYTESIEIVKKEFWPED